MTQEQYKKHQQKINDLRKEFSAFWNALMPAIRSEMTPRDLSILQLRTWNNWCNEKQNKTNLWQTLTK